MGADVRERDEAQDTAARSVDTKDEPLPQARIRTTVTIPLQLGPERFEPAEVISFHGLADQGEHVAVVFGDALKQDCPLVRVHSECLTGDVLGSARCDCGPQLRESMDLLNTDGGVLLYLRQEGRGIGLYNKLEAYLLQDVGMDTFAANRALNFGDDLRDYRVAAQMLSALGIRQVDVLTNNPDKETGLSERGIVVRRRLPTGVYVTHANRRYLMAKIDHAGHEINVEDVRSAQ
jgi:GTP cyclohydrolase II